MTKTAITGWVLSLVGIALYLYGYFLPGHPALVNWRGYFPGWLADYIPNIEAESGLILMIVAMVPLYWPTGDKI